MVSVVTHRSCVVLVFLFASLGDSAATITGTVTDASGRALEGVRIDHTGAMVVVGPVDMPPHPTETRSDAEGRFKVVTDAPAMVLRKPGYKSHRVRVNGDANLHVALQRIESKSRCRLATVPAFRTKKANDVDYTAMWFYIKTPRGRAGIISGSGPSYSWGAPSDNDVWTSVDYEEIMYDTGEIDASGHSQDGRYWRFRGRFGTAAHYYNQDRETARILDCVMDRVPLNAP